MLDKLQKAFKALSREVTDVRAEVNRLSVRPVVKDGKNGLPGPAGVDGIDGEIGETGPRGEVGERGRDGRDGNPGAIGAEGPRGQVGEEGAIGETGPRGLQGLKGDKGEPGPAGDKGEPGLKGETGDDGASITNVTLKKNELFVAIDGINKSVGKIQFPKNKVSPFTPSGDGGGGKPIPTPTPPDQVTKLIYSKDDYPDVIDGKIPLAGNTNYRHLNPTVTDFPFTHEDTTVFSGVDETVISVTYTGPGTMLTGVDSALKCKDITLICTDPASQFFSEENTIGNEKTSDLYLNNVTLNGYKLGDLTSLAALFIHSGDITQVVDGFSFFGEFGFLDIMWVDHAAAAGVVYKLGSTTFDGLKIINHNNTLAVGSAFISSDLPNSGNINVGGIGVISLGSFLEDVEPLQGILSSDDRWEMRQNDKIQDSRNAADVFLVGGASVVEVAVTDDWYEIGIPPEVGVSWESDISSRFSIGEDGTITYTGVKPLEASITARATLEKVGGGQELLEGRIAVNWQGSADGGLEKSRAQTQNSQPTSIPMGALTRLVNGDNIRLIFSNRNGVDDISAQVSALEIEG